MWTGRAFHGQAGFPLCPYMEPCGEWGHVTKSDSHASYNGGLFQPGAGEKKHTPPRWTKETVCFVMETASLLVYGMPYVA